MRPADRARAVLRLNHCFVLLVRELIISPQIVSARTKRIVRRLTMRVPTRLAIRHPPTTIPCANAEIVIALYLLALGTQLFPSVGFIASKLLLLKRRHNRIVSQIRHKRTIRDCFSTQLFFS